MARRTRHDGVRAEPVDDRGFAALANGEQHGHTFTQAVGPEDRVELARQLALAREVALQYPTVADAEAPACDRAGRSRPASARTTSPTRALGNADGAMSDDDIRAAAGVDLRRHAARLADRRPLLHEPEAENAEGFAGPNDTWHVHHNICIKTGPNGVDRRAARRRPRRDEGAVRRGRRQPAAADAVLAAHVGRCPGTRARKACSRTSARRSRATTGSYNTIADVTKIGTGHDDVQGRQRSSHRVGRRRRGRHGDRTAVPPRRVPPRVHATVTDVDGAARSRSTAPRSTRPAAGSRTTPARSPARRSPTCARRATHVWHTLDGAVPAVGRRSAPARSTGSGATN